MSKKDEYQEYVEEFMDDDKPIYKGGHTPSKQANNRANSPNNKEEEYDWGKHPNSQKALKKHQLEKLRRSVILTSFQLNIKYVQHFTHIK